MADVQYGPAKAADIAFIQSAAAESWAAAYGGIFAASVMARHLAGAYSAARILRAIDDPGEGFVVARDGGQVVGFSHFGDRGLGAELFQFYVVPSHWRRGVGGALLALTEEALRRRGRRSYICYVLRRNRIGRRFYDAHGFTRHPARDRGEEYCLRKVVAVAAERG